MIVPLEGRSYTDGPRWDDQIKGLAKKGKLTLMKSDVRLNCATIKVGHGGT